MVVWAEEVGISTAVPIGFCISLACTLSSRLIFNIREAATLGNGSPISTFLVQESLHFA
ncbi:hypothetical protein GALMADRAFT_1126554 [Galerina marginata CBS 339.88]|uniref:Uncharacterized protein n=1 Tax=Galerina marginata (strain CBS 339.88) TaxID=685588 RepID=A0A067SKE4_GALM3|nr:hypothetical protein GALMADRAFT_1126554 [Galerina marginata CBS 339.88]